MIFTNTSNSHLRDRNEWNGWIELTIGFVVAVVLLFCFYPDFILFNRTPMYAYGWELKDSAVTTMTFKPSLRVLQYEIYTHQNILWSSLRGMGMPLLAFDIQVAPLFPLTLLLSWVPEDIFWNLFVVFQLILMVLGTYLLVRRFFGFHRIPAIFFVLSFIYSLYVMRWMNHPWQNGLLAGIYYLYFLCVISVQGMGYSLKRLAAFSGLVLGVYSMVTCGFPEAAVMSAFLVVFVYVPFIIDKIRRRQIFFKSYLSDIILAHIAGLGLSSYQLFSIVEMMSLAGSHRKIGFWQYEASDLIPFFTEIITRFYDSAPTLYEDSRTFLGLIPVIFFLFGIGMAVRYIKNTGYGEVGAILCVLFIILKLFAVGPPWINELIARQPILVACYFYIYFFPVFLWFFSYFSARGLQFFLETGQGNDSPSIKLSRVMMLVIPCIVYLLLWYAAPVATGKTLRHMLLVNKQQVLLLLCWLFLSAIVVIHIYLFVVRRKVASLCLATVLLGLAIVEVAITLPSNFMQWSKTNHQELRIIQDFIAFNKLSPPGIRSSDLHGTYISNGMSTVDTGAAALIPQRTMMFRKIFFMTTGDTGRYSIEYPQNRFAWGLTSTNIRFLDRYYGGEFNFPEWNHMTRQQGKGIHFDTIQYNGNVLDRDDIVLLRANYKDLLFLKGWAIASKEKNPNDLAVYVVFENNGKEIVVPARKANRPDVARHLGDHKYIKSGWKAHLSMDVFKNGTYNVTIRAVDITDTTRYYEYKTKCSITFVRNDVSHDDEYRYGAGANGERMEYVGLLDHSYVYFDKSALPRAYIASKCQGFPDRNAVSSAFITMKANFQLGDVYLEHLDAAEEFFCLNYSRRSTGVPVLSDKGSELSLEAITGPSILVLNDNFYPGWRAVDLSTMERLDIKPANLTFRAVLLPENRDYHIQFQYKPDWLLYARLFLGMGICIILLVTAVTLVPFVVKNKS